MKNLKSAENRAGVRSLTLGLATFEKFSAMEGLALSRSQKKDFSAFEKRGLASDERRRALAAKYGKSRA